uniref:ATPase n=1 Tax=Ignisphaera aggregans TaxID=334771 RepID=A0A7C5UVN9_9CREN
MDIGLVMYAFPAIAEGLAVAGSTLGIQKAASVGAAVISEDPVQRGKVLALSFLPATQTMVYGFIYMFMTYIVYLPAILNKYKGLDAIPLNISFAIIGISLFVGLAEAFSAYTQGRVCADTAAQLIKTKGAIFGMGIVLAAYEELFGILGMVFGILMLSIVSTW